MTTAVSYLDLLNYVNAASDLAEHLVKEIKEKKPKHSKDTILKLNNFARAAQKIKNLVDQLEQDSLGLQ